VKDRVTFKASEMLRDGRAELALQVRVIKDWRFRLGLWMVRVGARLAGFAVSRTEEPDTLRVLKDCVRAWEKSDDMATPMAQARALIADAERGTATLSGDHAP